MIVARESGRDIFVRMTDGWDVSASVNVETQAEQVMPVMSKRIVVKGSFSGF